MFLLDVATAPLVLLAPVPIKIAVDSIIGTQPLPGVVESLGRLPLLGSATAILVIVAVLQVAVVVLAQLQQLASQLVHAHVGERLTLRFRARLFAHVQRLSLRYHDRQGPSDSVYRIQYDAMSIQNILDSAAPVMALALTLGTTVYVMSRIDATLALVALSVAPIVVGVSALYMGRVRDRYRDVKELESSALGVVHEVLGAVRVVKAFAREEHEEKRFLTHSGRSMRARVQLALSQGKFGLLINTTTAAGTAVVLFLGVRDVQRGTLTLGSLLLVVTYLAQLYRPLEGVSKRVADLQQSMAGAGRAFELLDELPDVSERNRPRRLVRARGLIQFSGVSFGYEPHKRVLHGVSFAVSPGMRLGVAGTTGAGKSTLISLLTRFYDPCEGQILLDGIDLREYRLSDLRNQFAMVLQDTVLFSATVAENISYARPDAPLSDVVAAATAANADGFIEALPEGYDTLVGDRGMLLSGGERQRIALARAFLKDAPILILDEPTSSVDVRTEAAIVDAMERLMEGRTVIMIAHRLSTLELCNAALQVDEGRAVMSDTTKPGVGSDRVRSARAG